MIDGSPVYPVEWEWFDENIYAFDDGVPILIDPANPRCNLLEGMTDEKRQKIREETARAITLLKWKYYGELFDPKQEQTDYLEGYFKIES
jgi:hypothetical protein